MAESYTAIFKRALESIVSQVPSGSGELMERFTQAFYAKMPVRDLESFDAKEAYAIAANAFSFVRERKAGEPKIRLFVPAEESEGWKHHHTIVEIINDDMPFLVDSVTTELTRLGYTSYATLHPVINVTRDANGKLTGLPESDGTPESIMHIEISTVPDEKKDELVESLKVILRGVRKTVEDWKPMMESAEKATAAFAGKTFIDAADIKEAEAFMQWLMAGNFIFLGSVEYDFGPENARKLSTVPDSEKGIFAVDDEAIRPLGLYSLPENVLHLALAPQLVEITKSARKSRIHRGAHMDYISLKRFDAGGNVTGELRFLGLFTSSVYYQSAAEIPILRRKIAQVSKRAGFSNASHDGKALKAILEFLPRDELFQMTLDELFECAMLVLSLEARPEVRLYVRRDAYERFLSCMIFLPRERFSTYQREQIQKILEATFNGTVSAYYTQVTDAPLARVNIIIRTAPGKIPPIDRDAVEKKIASVTHRWSDQLLSALNDKHSGGAAERLHRRYLDAFPKTYINYYSADQAVYDIGKVELALESRALALEFFHVPEEPPEVMHVKLYHPHGQVPLSDILPVLENFGFRVLEENPFRVHVEGSDEVWVHDFRLTHLSCVPDKILSRKALFEDALGKAWAGVTENDGFNALVLCCGLNWREVTLLRAYAKYLKQVGFPYSQPMIEKALAAHPDITHALGDLFLMRFEPRAIAYDNKKEEAVMGALTHALGGVTSLSDDRIIRRFIDLIRATVRTNYFQTDEAGAPKSYLSFKFLSARVPELPKPVPYAEIFVYSTAVEGIHLRGGKVARGGLRWSDRPEDFRTEVLGLMKAQMVKNAVIVPVGSKGGFVLKQAPTERAAWLEEGKRCYKIFLRGLLDLTDNIVKGETVRPKNLLRHDDDDPYLVVAADKGTATFSDLANSVSAEYGFWLGDAFASGGSVGYDHKAMGITAKGAWISVARHFRELGRDIQAEDFTVIGIGDMSGDVFGNGMLLSRHIKLLAAFNHLHIFLDPNPDAEQSFVERERLFALPRSGWNDYSAALISKGGGVFERSAKSVPLSAEVKATFGITVDSMAPDELIRTLLAAPVDLLWNGGIGTYVKAETETHEQVGDRTNNALRVNGQELQCKVVGEGGNLGFTQKGRIEYALKGGRINTDAIDNSAGVDCSDHEVNIKIALNALVAAGTLSLEKRNEFLASMTDEVAALVLRDNLLQTQAISIAQARGVTVLDGQARFMVALERGGLLSRKVEYLPSIDELVQRKSLKLGLTRPELAVLLAYAKMTLYPEILSSGLPDDAYFVNDLMRYFPKPMQEQFKGAIEAHPLRREIIATFVTNSVVNRAGITFFQSIMADTGLPAAHIARAYTAARDVFELRPLWAEIEASNAAEDVKVEMFLEINRFVGRITLWLCQNMPRPLDIDDFLKSFGPGIREFRQKSVDFLSGPSLDSYNAKLGYFTEEGVPEALARRIAELESLGATCDIVKVARAVSLTVSQVAEAYFDIGTRLGLAKLRQMASRIAFQSYWDRLAMFAIIEDLYEQQRRLTAAAIQAMGKDAGHEGALESWFTAHAEEIGRFLAFLADLESTTHPDVPMLTVATRNAKGLCVV